MSGIPLGIATACYIWTSVDLYFNNSAPMAGVFFFYALANLCLLWLAYGGR